MPFYPKPKKEERTQEKLKIKVTSYRILTGFERRKDGKRKRRNPGS